MYKLLQCAFQKIVYFCCRTSRRCVDRNKLDTEVNGIKNIIDLEKEISEDKIILTWIIEKSHVLYSGYMAIQIRAFSGNEEIWHSTQEYVQVLPSINATESQPDPLPSEFVQMEQRVTTMKERL